MKLKILSTVANPVLKATKRLTGTGRLLAILCLFLVGMGGVSKAQGYNQNACAFVPFVLGAPTNLGNADDAVFGPVAIPFTFTFYGNAFTTVFASTNGFLSFGAIPGIGNGCCQGQALPNVNFANSIAIAWSDWITTITVQTLGVTPNRIMVFNWNGTEFGGGGTINAQVALFETTNEIRFEVTNISSAHIMTQGLDKDGVTSDPVAGRNATTWGETNTCQSFTPVVGCVISPPASATGASICGPGNATTVGVAGAGGNSIRWYAAPVGGAPLFTGLSYTAAYAVTTTIYAANFNTINNCENATRTAVTVTVLPVPVPTITGLVGPYPSSNPPVTMTGTPSGGVFTGSCGACVVGNQFLPTVAGPGTFTVTYTLPSYPGDYSAQSIPYAPVAGPGIPGPAGDDILSAAIPLGFTFNFFGVNYTQCYISTNGKK